MKGPGFAPRRLALVFLCASPLALIVELAAGREFSEEITVEEIEIPVHVVRKGSSVSGLKREDFHVFVDGELVDIVGFNVLERHAVGEPEASEAEPAKGEPVATPTASKRPQHLLLLFDLLFAPQHDHDLLQALQGAREMTSRQLEPDDRAALAVVGPGGATILVGFTPDREELEIGFDVLEAMLKHEPEDAQAGLARLRRHVDDESGDAGDLAGLSQRFGSTAALVFGDHLGSGLNLAHLVQGVGFGTFDPALDIDREGRVTRVPENERPAGSDPLVSSLVEVTPEELAAELAESIEGSRIRLLAGELERLAILLRDVPSPNEVLYLAHGFSPSILEDFGASNQARVLRYLGQMHEALLRGGWILHAIDLEGIPAREGVPVVGSSSENVFSVANAPATNRPGFDAHALYYMANETGGQLMENYNRLEQATHALLGRTRVTYLLTIQPDSVTPDGRRHRIEVKLRDRELGMRIYHRPAYYAERAGEASSPLETQLQAARQWLGDEEVNPLAVVVHVGRVRDAGSANRIGLMMEIPGTVITGRRTAGIVPVEIQVLVLDSEGGVQTTLAREMAIDLAKVGPRLQDRTLCLHVELDVPLGPHRLRTVVHIPTRDETSFLTPSVAESWQELASERREECLDVSL